MSEKPRHRLGAAVQRPSPARPAMDRSDNRTGVRVRAAKIADDKEAEDARADLEYELNHGRYQEASRMTWERFRELFETEFVASRRDNTRRNYSVMMDLFERVCNPKTLRAITERTISAFVAGLRKLPGYANDTMLPSTIKVRVQFLHTAMRWAADQKLIPECPRFPSIKVPKKKPQSVPTESVEKMLLKTGDDLALHAFLLCGWLAGLRLNEATRSWNGRKPTRPRTWTRRATGSSSPPRSSRRTRINGSRSILNCGRHWTRCRWQAARCSTSVPWTAGAIAR